jgi:CubicO group peptidase (beta-lactamase class C family)
MNQSPAVVTSAGLVATLPRRRQLLKLAASWPVCSVAWAAGAQGPSPAAPPSSRFAEVDAGLRRLIESEGLPGASYAVIRHGRPVAQGVFGWADREARVALREDHLFRIFSNTKLVVSCAALQLMEKGAFQLDDPVAAYLPEMRDLRVLRPGADSVQDVVAAAAPVTVRQMLAHTSGMTYTFLDPTSVVGKAYGQAGMLSPTRSLAQVARAAGDLPLLFQPGSDWNYSMGTDVVGRLIEVWTGRSLDAVLRDSVFDPLGMRDTMFFIPGDQQGRLAAMYVGDLKDPSRPGLRRADELPYPGANLKPVPRLFAGGGLVTSLPDWMKLLAALSTGGQPLLRPQTLPLVFDNQLPAGMWIKSLSDGARVPGRGHSLAASVTTHTLSGTWSGVPGDVEWGGLAGTHWLISPRDGVAFALMTQRFMGFELPFWMDFKRSVRLALEA